MSKPIRIHQKKLIMQLQFNLNHGWLFLKGMRENILQTIITQINSIPIYPNSIETIMLNEKQNLN
jgi:hypothetical protein